LTVLCGSCTPSGTCQIGVWVGSGASLELFGDEKNLLLLQAVEHWTLWPIV